MTHYNEIHILFVEFIILLVFVYYCSRTQARTHVYVYTTKRSFWQVRCQTIKALELHTIFALIASIFILIRDVIQIRLNLFYFILFGIYAQKYNGINTHIWCVYKTMMRRMKKKKKRARKRADAVIV